MILRLGLSRLQTLLLSFPVVICLFVVNACATTARSTAIVIPTATSANIIVTTDFTTYHAGQAIGVSVRNVSPSAYFATDAHTACTIVTLQQSLRGQWVSLMPCQSGQSAHVLLIAVHSTVPYTLAPGNAAGNPNAWAPGVYRIALAFGLRPDGSDAGDHVVYSAGFTVIP